VFAEPLNQEAKGLLADAFEQLGYQQESPSVRNSFLAAALELRSGIPTGGIPKTGGPDVIRALSTSQFLDFLGIRLDSVAAADVAFTLNLITPDTGETYAIELSNSTLTNLGGFLADDPDLTITVDRSNLEEAMIGATSLQQLIVDGLARLDGDPAVLATLGSLLVHFEVGFEIMPGTGNAEPESSTMGDFEQEPLADTAGG